MCTVMHEYNHKEKHLFYGTVYIHSLNSSPLVFWSYASSFGEPIACVIKDKLKEINHGPMLGLQLKVAAVQNFAWLINIFHDGAEYLTYT